MKAYKPNSDGKTAVPELVHWKYEVEPTAVGPYSRFPNIKEAQCKF